IPENGLELAEVGLGQVSAGIDGAVVHTANFERKRVRLRRHEEIRAQGAEFFRQTVADIERHTQRGGGYSHAEGQRRPGQELVAWAESKRIGNECPKTKCAELFCFSVLSI